MLRFIRGRELIRRGERAVVAVSGGADSTALLEVMSSLRLALGVELAAAHFDHMLRDRSEAEGDEGFVRALCERLGVPLVCGRGNVAARARRHRESVEDAARQMRYRFLSRAARETGASIVLLGHTANDQAETVLLHMLRGSGLGGLAGMRPRSGWPLGTGPAGGRPLLQLTRAETERYCRELGLKPREDPTNQVLIATRNRVRHELLPKLREFNPRVETALARLADAAAQDTGVLDALADDAFRAAAGNKRSGVCLPRTMLSAIAPAVRARVIRRAFEAAAGSPGGLEAAHVDALESLIGRPRGRLSLPRGVVAALGADALIFRLGGVPRAAAMPETALTVPGITAVGGWVIRTALVSPQGRPGRAEPSVAYIDAGAIEGALTVRSRRPGDRLRPLGLGGERKVQDILVDAGVPEEERDGVPIVSDARGILWIAGQRLDERAALGPESRQALRIEARREH